MTDYFTQVLQRLISLLQASPLIAEVPIPQTGIVDYTDEEWADPSDPEIDNPEGGDLPRIAIEQAEHREEFYTNVAVKVVQNYNIWLNTDTLQIGGETSDQTSTLNTVKSAVLQTLYGQPDDTLGLSPLVMTWDVIRGKDSRENVVRERGSRKWVGLSTISITMIWSLAAIAV